jgi:hypothetical protein
MKADEGRAVTGSAAAVAVCTSLRGLVGAPSPLITGSFGVAVGKTLAMETETPRDPGVDPQITTRPRLRHPWTSFLSISSFGRAPYGVHGHPELLDQSSPGITERTLADARMHQDCELYMPLSRHIGPEWAQDVLLSCRYPQTWELDAIDTGPMRLILPEFSMNFWRNR